MSVQPKGKIGHGGAGDAGEDTDEIDFFSEYDTIPCAEGTELDTIRSENNTALAPATNSSEHSLDYKEGLQGIEEDQSVALATESSSGAIVAATTSADEIDEIDFFNEDEILKPSIEKHESKNCDEMITAIAADGHEEDNIDFFEEISEKDEVNVQAVEEDPIFFPEVVQTQASSGAEGNLTPSTAADTKNNGSNGLSSADVADASSSLDFELVDNHDSDTHGRHGQIPMDVDVDDDDVDEDISTIGEDHSESKFNASFDFLSSLAEPHVESNMDVEDPFEKLFQELQSRALEKINELNDEIGRACEENRWVNLKEPPIDGRVDEKASLKLWEKVMRERKDAHTSNEDYVKMLTGSNFSDPDEPEEISSIFKSLSANILNALEEFDREIGALREDATKTLQQLPSDLKLPFDDEDMESVEDNNLNNYNEAVAGTSLNSFNRESSFSASQVNIAPNIPHSDMSEDRNHPKSFESDRSRNSAKGPVTRSKARSYTNDIEKVKTVFLNLNLEQPNSMEDMLRKCGTFAEDKNGVSAMAMYEAMDNYMKSIKEWIRQNWGHWETDPSSFNKKSQYEKRRSINSLSSSPEPFPKELLQVVTKKLDEAEQLFLNFKTDHDKGLKEGGQKVCEKLGKVYRHCLSTSTGYHRANLIKDLPEILQNSLLDSLKVDPNSELAEKYVKELAKHIEPPHETSMTSRLSGSKTQLDPLTSNPYIHPNARSRGIVDRVKELKEIHVSKYRDTLRTQASNPVMKKQNFDSIEESARENALSEMERGLRSIPGLQNSPPAINAYMAEFTKELDTLRANFKADFDNKPSSSSFNFNTLGRQAQTTSTNKDDIVVAVHFGYEELAAATQNSQGEIQMLYGPCGNHVHIGDEICIGAKLDEAEPDSNSRFLSLKTVMLNKEFSHSWVFPKSGKPEKYIFKAHQILACVLKGLSVLVGRKLRCKNVSELKFIVSVPSSLDPEMLRAFKNGAKVAGLQCDFIRSSSAMILQSLQDSPLTTVYGDELAVLVESHILEQGKKRNIFEATIVSVNGGDIIPKLVVNRFSKPNDGIFEAVKNAVWGVDALKYCFNKILEGNPKRSVVRVLAKDVDAQSVEHTFNLPRCQIDWVDKNEYILSCLKGALTSKMFGLQPGEPKFNLVLKYISSTVTDKEITKHQNFLNKVFDEITKDVARSKQSAKDRLKNKTQQLLSMNDSTGKLKIMSEAGAKIDEVELSPTAIEKIFQDACRQVGLPSN